MKTVQSQPARVLLPAGDGFVHARCLGNGPPLVMLHECPRSSLSLLPLMQMLATRFTCIALDTPGYGESSALPADATVEDFAVRIFSAMDAIPLDAFALYGTHTGAAIAVVMAQRAPARIHHLFLDGPPAFLEGERASLVTHYLPPIDARRDGAHLATLWTRVTDQQVFFPFFERGPEARQGGTGRHLREAHRSALGFLMAGEHYRTAYCAAINFPMVEAIDALGDIPLSVSCKASDMLVGHLSRLRCRSEVYESHTQTASAMLRCERASALPALPVSQLIAAQACSQRYVSLGGQSVRCWRYGTDRRPPHFSLRDPLGNASQVALDIDLPGFGASADGIEWGFSPPGTDVLAIMEAALGSSFSAQSVGCRALAFLCRVLSITPPAALEAVHAAPDLIAAAAPWRRSLPAPDWGGGHIHALWTLAREFVEDPLGGSPLSCSGDAASQLDATQRIFLYLLKSLPALLACQTRFVSQTRR